MSGAHAQETRPAGAGESMKGAMCEKPGCVAEADIGGLCPAHRTGLGKPCEACNGSGTTWRTNQTTMKAQREACDRCCGTGLRDARKHQPRERRDADPIDGRGLIRIASEE